MIIIRIIIISPSSIYLTINYQQSIKSLLNPRMVPLTVSSFDRGSMTLALQLSSLLLAAGFVFDRVPNVDVQNIVNGNPTPSLPLPLPLPLAYPYPYPYPYP